MLETVLTGVMDQYPTLRPHKTLVILAISIVFFIIGLPLCAPVGRNANNQNNTGEIRDCKKLKDVYFDRI